MKKCIAKKAFVYSVLTILFAGCSAQAAESAPSLQAGPTGTPAPGVTQSEIGAQAAVISDGIEDALRKMDLRKGDISFNLRDYWEQLTESKKNFQTALQEFKQSMGDEKSGFLGRVAMVFEKYNSVYRSTSFSPEQKEILLKSAREYVLVHMSVLQSEYSQLIGSVFSKVFDGKFVVPELAHDGYGQVIGKCAAGGNRFEVQFRSFSKIESSFGVCGWARDLDRGAQGVIYGKHSNKKGYSNPVASYPMRVKPCSYCDETQYFRFLHDTAKYSPEDVDAFQPVVKNAGDALLAFASQGCRSRMCIGMRSGDLVFAAGLLQVTVNVTRTMKLANGEEIKLNATALDGTWAIQQMSRTDYPTNLPFDTD